MEIELMNQYVQEMKGEKCQYQSIQYNTIDFIVTILWNLHRQNHEKSCFKNQMNADLKFSRKKQLNQILYLKKNNKIGMTGGGESKKQENCCYMKTKESIKIAV